MEPGTGFYTDVQRERATAYVAAIDYAHEHPNQLLTFLQEAGGRVRWSFKHSLTAVNKTQMRYELRATIEGEQGEGSFPLDSVTALLHNLSGPLIASRGDHVFLPEIANSVSGAIARELEDQTISPAERDRLIHLRAHATYIRDAFNLSMRRPSSVLLETKLSPDETLKQRAHAEHAVEALFYCGGHPNPGPPPKDPRSRRAFVQRLAKKIREGSPAGHFLTNSAGTALIESLPLLRRLATVIRDWLGGSPHELPDLYHGDRDLYLQTASAVPQ